MSLMFPENDIALHVSTLLTVRRELPHQRVQEYEAGVKTRFLCLRITLCRAKITAKFRKH